MPEASQILSVSSLNQKVAQLLESGLGVVWLEAEIGQFTAAGSGHWYLTLKDARAQVRCAMFKFKNRSVRQQPKPGDKVLVKANVSLYQPRGEFQLVLEMMMPAGQGRLQLEFEQLKQRLSALGLFNAEQKKPLPQAINRLGIISSASAAALQDILSVLQRRDPGMAIILYPSLVQGTAAETQLISAIETANRRNEVDALLLTRGGGSLEDLWCFNSEKLAHSIAASKLPVVSAVGHEIDFTIADLVADLRAATPSAAAELLSQDCSVRYRHIEQLLTRLHTNSQHRFEQQQHRLSRLQLALERQAPAKRLQANQQQLDEKQFRLQQLTDSVLQQARLQQQRLSARLWQQQPIQNIEKLRERTENLEKQLHHSLQAMLTQQQQRWKASVQALELVSPLAILARGYSITTHQGSVVSSTTQLEPGDRIVTRVADGEITSAVIEQPSTGVSCP